MQNTSDGDITKEKVITDEIHIIKCSLRSVLSQEKYTTDTKITSNSLSDNSFNVQKKEDGEAVTKINKELYNKIEIEIKNLCLDQKNTLPYLFRKRTLKINKIVLEGIYGFTVYVKYIVKENIPMKINSNTIRRCMRHLIIGANKSKEKCYPEEDKLINSVLDQFFNFSADGRVNDFTNNEDGLMKPAEASADSYFVNLKLHITRNFKRYQRRYLKLKSETFKSECNIQQIPETDINFLLRGLQHKINGNNDFIYYQS